MIWLTSNKTEEANHIIDTFFESRSVKSIRDDLRSWYEVVITSNHPGYESGHGSGDLFLLYTQLEQLIEANYVLQNSSDSNQD